MIEVALKLLEEINSKGFESYIVGGFVRDYILGIESNDIDIATNATPKDVKEIFEDSCLPSEDYGSVTVVMKGIRFEITTFRRDIKYENNNGEYTNKDFEDLIRSKLWEHLGERLWAFMISEKSAKNRINNIIKDYSLNNTNIILKKLDSSYSISILNI